MANPCGGTYKGKPFKTEEELNAIIDKELEGEGAVEAEFQRRRAAEQTKQPETTIPSKTAQSSGEKPQDITYKKTEEEKKNESVMKLANDEMNKMFGDNGQITKDTAKRLSKSEIAQQAVHELNNGIGRSIDDLLSEIKKGRPVTDVESVKLGLETVKLSKLNRDISEKLNEPQSPKESKEKVNEILQNELRQNEIVDAIKKTGTHASDAMSIREELFKMTSTPEGFIQEIKSISGSDVPQNIVNVVKKIFKDREANDDRIAEIRDKYSKDNELKENKPLADLLKKYEEKTNNLVQAKETREKAKIERKSIENKFSEISRRYLGQLSANGPAGMALEIANELPNYAKALVKEGIANVNVLLKTIQDTLKSYGVEMDYKNIRAAILREGDYAKEVLPRKLSDFVAMKKKLSQLDKMESEKGNGSPKKLPALHKELRTLYTDAAKALVKSKDKTFKVGEGVAERDARIAENKANYETKAKEIADKKQEISDYKDNEKLKKEIAGTGKPGLTFEQKREKYKSDLSKSFVEKQNKIKTGSIDTKKVNKDEYVNDEIFKLQVANERNAKILKTLRLNVAEGKLSWWKKVLNTQSKLKTANILFGLRVPFKLFKIAILRAIGMNIGEVYKAIQPANYISNLTKGTIYEGGADFGALKKGDEALVKQFGSSIAAIWKHSENNLESMFNKSGGSDENDSGQFKKVSLIGLFSKKGAARAALVDDYAKLSKVLHGIIKAPITVAAEDYTRERLLNNIRRETGNPALKMEDLPERQQREINERAFNEGQRIKSMQENDMSKLWTNAIRKTGKEGGLSYFLKTEAKVAIPIVKVPTNLVGEGLQYAFGLTKGLSQLIYHSIKGDLARLDVKTRERITRDINKGTLGAAVMVYAALNPEQFLDEKGKFTKFFGHEVPKGIMTLCLHHPIFLPLKMGAEFTHILRQSKTDEDAGFFKSVGEKMGKDSLAIAGAIGAGIEDVPFINFIEQYKYQKAPDVAMETFISSVFMPQMMKEVAKTTDIPEDKKDDALNYVKNFFSQDMTIERTPQYWWEKVLNQNVPWLRETLKPKKATGVGNSGTVESQPVESQPVESQPVESQPQ